MLQPCISNRRCVGAVVHDTQGRLLLVRRARDPGRGRWSLPGGKTEPGETDQQAVLREVAEETGISVVVQQHLGSVTIPAPKGAVFDVHDYACRPLGHVLRPGDDAENARWCDADGFAALPLVPGLADTLAAWGCLPQ